MLKNVSFEIYDEFDKEFVQLLIEIDKRHPNLDKYSKLKVENWVKKLCQVTNNREWKKNRNLYSILLLDMILNNKFELPFSKFANEGPLPTISKVLVKTKLSKKIFEISTEETENQFDVMNNMSKATDTIKNKLIKFCESEDSESKGIKI